MVDTNYSKYAEPKSNKPGMCRGSFNEKINRNFRADLNRISSTSSSKAQHSIGQRRIKGAPESNWIQTLDGGDWLVGLRIYGSAVEFFDQTWKPDDVVKLK